MLAVKELNNPEEIELIANDAQILFIDNQKEDTQPLENAFNNLNIGNQFLLADDVEPKYPNSTFENVKLIFLDLYYNENFGAGFNAYICAEYLLKTVPQGKKYSLVIWSKDVEKTEELLSVIDEVGATAPSVVIPKSKSEYLVENVEDNIARMLSELGIKIVESDPDIQEYLGEIIEVEDDSILINCLISLDPSYFQIRRFDRGPFNDHVDLSIGNFISIRCTTKPGSRLFEFNNEAKDLSSYFKKDDYFKGLENSSFFTEE